MASNEVKITGGSLDGGKLENAATEATLRELLEATKRTLGDSQEKTKSLFEDLVDSSKSASDSIDEFSDELESTNKTVKAYNIASQAAGETIRAFDRSLRSISDVSDSAQDQLQQFGSMASSSMSTAGGAAVGLGAALTRIPGPAKLVGVGLTGLGAVLSGLGTATSALVGALGTVIGMAQGFQESFNRISATGFTLDGSFEDLVNSTLAANLTLGQFAGVIERNRADMAMFGGSVNRGARRVLELREAMSDEMVGGFINMGLSLEEIPDVLSRYMVLMGRSGRLMEQTDQEAIESAQQLFRQQRLLADLTGNSVEAIQNEALERTRATRVQAAFNEMVPGAAAAYANAAGMVEAELGPGLARGFEAIFAGDLTDPVYQAMLGGAPRLTAALEEVRAGIASGAISQENASAAIFEAIQNNAPAIEQELDAVAETLRYSGLDTPLNALGEGLGLALERLSTIYDRSYEEAMALIERQAAGAPDEDGEGDAMLESFRNITEGAQTVKVALQNVAMQITNAIGDEASGVFVSFANALTAVTDELLGIAGLGSGGGEESVGGAAWGGAGEGATVGATVGGTFFGLPGALGGAVIGGLMGAGIGAIRQHLENLDSRDGERALPQESYQDPLGEDYVPGAATGNILTGPASGYLAELHGTEAVVPLPNGRSIPVDLGESNTAPIEMLSGTLERTIGGYTSQLSALSFESLHGELRQLGTALTDRNALAAEQTNSASTDFSTGLDSSRTLSEMLQVNRNMLNQMISSTQKLEQMIRTMEQSNTISRNTAYARA